MALVAAAFFTLLFFVRLARSPWRDVWNWWLVLLLITTVTSITFLIYPGIEGFVAIGTFLLFVLTPLRLDRAAQRATRLGQDDRAATLAVFAMCLHPAAALRRRPRVLRAIARVRREGRVDESIFTELGVADDPGGRELYRVVALASAMDISALFEAIQAPKTRNRLIAMGGGLHVLRGLSESFDSRLIESTIEQVERQDPLITDPERRALVLLEACSLLGDEDGVEVIGAHLAGKIAPGVLLRARTFARYVSGQDTSSLLNLAVGELDPVASRGLTRLRTLPAPPNLTVRRYAAELEPIRTRLNREVHAFAKLSPLGGQGGRTRLTYATIVVLGIVYAIEAFTGDPLDPAHLASLGGLVVPMTSATDVYQFITSSLLHAGPLHLGMNVLALVSFGRFVESFYGGLRYVLIWLVATVVSGSTVALMAKTGQQTVLVGASGAIFGLGGALASALLRDPVLRASRRGRQELISFGVLVAAQVFFDQLIPQVSGAAHLGGLAGGAVIALILMPSKRQAALPPRGLAKPNS